MFRISPYLDDNRIYDDERLKEFIIEIENEYNFVDNSEFFSNLVNFSDNETLAYHRWFKYREGYGRELVKRLIEEEQLTFEEFVIDPFCGSGTTLVEAASQGFSSFGIDVNPMSAFVTDTKVECYEEEELQLIHFYIEEIKRLSLEAKDEEKKLPKSFTEYRWEFLNNYFSHDHLYDIKKLVEFIESIQVEKVRNFFMTACLAITEDISDRRRDGNGLKRSSSRVESVYDKLIEQLKQMFKDITEFPVSRSTVGEAITSSAVSLKYHADVFMKKTSKKPGVIIFSPPYVNSFDYFESYKMELYLGGFVNKRSEMRELRDKAVHSFVKSTRAQPEVEWFIDQMAIEIENAIPEKENRTGRKDLRTRKVPALIRGYFYDMSKILKACADTLPSDKRTFIVVDQSAYLGKIVPTDLFLGKLAEKHGFEVERILVCRRAKTSAQQYSLYPYLEHTLRESIVVLKKR